MLLVASTDMSHFVSAATAHQLDHLALAQFEALNPAGLHDVVRQEHITMCGVVPTTAVLEAAVRLGCQKAEVIDYTHSGLVTGDDARVVAYAGGVMTGSDGLN